MTHYMKLQNHPFFQIYRGEKTVELRLYDEKRKLIRVGDEIVFVNVLTNERLRTEVTALYPSSSFEHLFETISPTRAGFTRESGTDPLQTMHSIYSMEQILTYGVLGIGIRRIP